MKTRAGIPWRPASVSDEVSVSSVMAAISQQVEQHADINDNIGRNDPFYINCSIDYVGDFGYYIFSEHFNPETCEWSSHKHAGVFMSLCHRCTLLGAIELLASVRRLLGPTFQMLPGCGWTWHQENVRCIDEKTTVIEARWWAIRPVLALAIAGIPAC